MTELTYARLDELLRSAGFVMRGMLDKNKIYWHASSGALITFPAFPDEDPVHPRYLTLVRVTFKTYGIEPIFDVQAKPTG